MDFNNVIEAIDYLIKTRVQDAAYTKMLSATIIGIENSENNSYNVTSDNGKTTQLAIDIALSNNEVHYKKGDAVQLLQLNGIGNTNTNLYIVGKSGDLSKKDLEDIKDYFIIQNSVSFKDGETDLIIPNSVIENIKIYKSFVVSAKFTVAPTVSEEDKYYNYGLKVILTFSKNGKEYNKEFIFDTTQMTGQPWNYNGVVQTFERQLDDIDAPFLVSGKIQKIFEPMKYSADTGIDNVTISSALYNEENSYTAEMVNAKKVEYITRDIDSVELKVNFYKNNSIFASSDCKYYWFIKDANITLGSAGYNEYGGIGWRCLNSITTNTYYNEVAKTSETEETIDNNIGDSLLVDNAKLEQYHNYFKCVVVYGKRVAATSVKEVVNIRRANISGSLSAEPSAIVKDIGKELKIILTLTGDTSLVKKIDWYYQKNDGDKVLTKSVDIAKDKEPYSLILNKTSKPTLFNFLGEKETVVSYDLFNIDDSTNKKILLDTGSLIIINNLVIETWTETWYYDSGTSTKPPEKPTEKDLENKIWKQTPEECIGPYIWFASRQKSETYTGSFGDVGCYSTNGPKDRNEAAAAQLTEFNRLTNNGQDQGLYYGERYIVTSDTAVKADKIYYTLTIENNIKRYEQFKDTAFEAGVTYYEKEADGNLYINADYINTGTLRVGDGDNEKFYASVNSKDVRIGGFTVDNMSMQTKDGITGISSGDYLIWGGGNSSDKANAKFYVTKEGRLHSTSGDIGGFTITNQTIENNYSKSDSLGSAGISADTSSGLDSVAFWAGVGKATPNFKVTYGGDVFCNKVFSFGENATVNWTQETTPLKYYLYSTAIEKPDNINLISYKEPQGWLTEYNSNSIWYAYSSTGEKGTFKGPFTLQGQDGAPGKDGQDLTTNVQTFEDGDVYLSDLILSPERINTINLKNCSFNLGGVAETILAKGNWSLLVMGWEE